MSTSCIANHQDFMENHYGKFGIRSKRRPGSRLSGQALWHCVWTFMACGSHGPHRKKIRS